jgi:hypothetical protein
MECEGIKMELVWRGTFDSTKEDHHHSSHSIKLSLSARGSLIKGRKGERGAVKRINCSSLSDSQVRVRMGNGAS